MNAPSFERNALIPGGGILEDLIEFVVGYADKTGILLKISTITNDMDEETVLKE